MGITEAVRTGPSEAADRARTGPLKAIGPLNSTGPFGSARAWPPATAIVTGATGGIGGALAQALRAAGTRVLASGRDPVALKRLSAVGCAVVAEDARDPAAAERLVAAAVERLGGHELVVAAAGIGAVGAVVDMEPERITDLLAVDLTAPILLARAALPGMLDAGGGRVLLVGSVAGALAVRDEAVYGAAKAGLASFATALRSEVRGRGVSVTLAVPGVVDTAFFARRGRPYARSRPRPLPADRAAAAILEATRRGRAEVWTPGWLAAVSRLRGAAPRTYHRLADAIGGTS